MIKLYDSNITDILPSVLANQEKVIALGYAINQALQRLITYCEETSVYAVIDSLPDNILDLLALELNTQYYEDSLDVKTKRELVKNTLVWYEHSGTAAAVAELITTVFGEGEVKEWFEYGGEPFFFKIYTSATITEEAIEAFNQMIRKIKNTRSHLETVVADRDLKQTLYIGISCRAMAKVENMIE